MPVPDSVRVESAWTRKGMNWRGWAFHFTIAPEDLPKILAGYPYRHEIEPAGVDLSRVRDFPRDDPDYPTPPADFRAVHRYSHRAPTSRAGRDVTLYGNASQTEFYIYGSFE